MPRSSPVRARLVACVQDQAEICRNEGRATLPSIGSMAASCKVSYETMWKAVNECRRNGLLTVAAGGRVRLGPASHRTDTSSSQPSTPPPLLPKWESVREQVRTDLIQGSFARGLRLPPYKVLAERYGAGFRVMRVALTALREEGYLEPCPGGLRPHRPSRSSADATIALLSAALREGGSHGVAFGRNWDVVRALEKECAAAGCRLVRQDVRDAGASVRSLGGTVLWTSGLEEPQRLAAVHTLAASGKPLAVLDESALTHYAAASHPSSLVQLFTLGSRPVSGEAVGRHLLSLGHRHVAYFSSLANETRLDGLRRALRRADAGNTVSVYRQHIDGAEADQAVRDGTVGLSISAPAASGVDQAAGLLADLMPHLSYAMLGEFVRKRFAAHFAQALGEASTTAWVGCSDIIAVQCLRFLRERGVAVPQTVSVVGFDDSTDAALCGLTSYNFNVAGLASAMVTHLLHPQPRRSRRGMGEWYEPAGLVTVRESSGAAQLRPSSPGRRPS